MKKKTKVKKGKIIGEMKIEMGNDNIEVNIKGGKFKFTKSITCGKMGIINFEITYAK